MSNKFNVGDRVILTGRGLTPYINWPVWGSKFSCVGTITKVESSFLYILWDNGTNNAIIYSDISYYRGSKQDVLCPNIAFMLHKRKNDGKV